ncbi:DUF7660 family protein [Anaerohalosphaeraceae bacterium U12dextr]
MINLNEAVQNIKNKNDLASFIKLLLDDLKNNENDWENATLERYLESMSAWLADSDGLSLNLGKELPKQPDWNTIGDILLAAKYYE